MGTVTSTPGQELPTSALYTGATVQMQMSTEESMYMAANSLDQLQQIGNNVDALMMRANAIAANPSEGWDALAAQQTVQSGIKLRRKITETIAAKQRDALAKPAPTQGISISLEARLLALENRVKELETQLATREVSARIELD